MLAGAAELRSIDPAPRQLAVCDDAAAALLESAWPEAEILRTTPPTAGDALRLAAPRVAEGAFVDLALLDGTICAVRMRRSLARPPRRNAHDGWRQAFHPPHARRGHFPHDADSRWALHAPHWPPASYQTALDARSEPRRMALVGETLERETPARNGPAPGTSIPTAVVGFVVASLVAGEAELESIARRQPSAQRRGAGGQLLGHLLAALREGNVTPINLGGARHQPRCHRPLHRRHGFIETGRRVAYYADPVEDAILLSLPGLTRFRPDCDSVTRLRFFRRIPQFLSPQIICRAFSLPCVRGDICKCSVTSRRCLMDEVQDPTLSEEIRSPACRTSSLRSAAGRIASETLSLRRRTARRSSPEETQTARQGPDLCLGAPAAGNGLRPRQV